MLWRQCFETLCGLWIHWVLKPYERIACGKFTLWDPRGDFSSPSRVSGPNQNLPSDTSWKLDETCTKETQIHLYSPTHLSCRVYTKTLGCEGCEACERVRLWSSLRCLLDHVACGTWQPCRTEAVRKAALPSRPRPDRHTSVSNQAEQQIHHLHQIKIDQRGSMHESGTCPPWKLRSWTLPAIKRLAPGYGCHPNSHPTISKTQPMRPDLSSSSMRALPAATWLGSVLPRGLNFSVALRNIGLSTGASWNEKKCRRTQSNIWNESRGEGIMTLKVTDSEQECRRHRPTGQDESRSRQLGGSL